MLRASGVVRPIAVKHARVHQPLLRFPGRFSGLLRRVVKT